MAVSWTTLYLAPALGTAAASQAAGQTLMFLLTRLHPPAPTPPRSRSQATTPCADRPDFFSSELAGTLGHTADAERRLQAATSVNERPGARRWLARTWPALADILSGQPDEPSQAQAAALGRSTTRLASLRASYPGGRDNEPLRQPSAARGAIPDLSPAKADRHDLLGPLTRRARTG
jgi:hypothetical protein